MRIACLGVTLLAVVACSTAPTTPDCAPTLSRTSALGPVILEHLPRDSVITVLIQWSATEPGDLESTLAEHQLSITYRFHYQAAMLVRGTAGDVIAFRDDYASAKVETGATGTTLDCH